MKNKLTFLLGAFAALAFSSSAIEPRIPTPVPPIAEASLAGLQISLTTSGYKFFLAEPAAEGAVTKPVREWFAASVLVANRSSTDIPFTFPTSAAADLKWTFRIFNRAGEQLWQSDSDVMSAQVLTEVRLEKRGRWKRLIQVPLRIAGKLLTPGLYTLEASIDADKSVSATALFEVALPPLTPIPDKNTGIKGAVLLPGDGDKPASGALLYLMELRDGVVPLPRAPFVWSGRADELGKFQVVTPAGRYRVTTTAINIPRPAAAGIALPPLLLPKTVEVTVTAGAFSEAILRLEQSIR